MNSRSSAARFSGPATAGALAMLALHVALRAYGLFGAPQDRKYIMVSFLLLWPSPWLFLRREERAELGLGRARKASWWPLAAVTGMAAALVCFGLSFALYGASAQNPFVSIRDSYLNRAAIPDVGPVVLFLIFTGPAMIFSPFGEEVFCRGVIYGRARAWFGSLVGAATSATVFASIHLMHHGITLTDGALGFIGFSGVLWFGMMFFTALLFTALRRGGGTLWLAVLSHAFFNLAMNALIFSVLR